MLAESGDLNFCKMAEEVLKKLFEEQLNCSICLDTYTTPVLPCLLPTTPGATG